jgi:hypothetical protein
MSVIRKVSCGIIDLTDLIAKHAEFNLYIIWKNMTYPGHSIVNDYPQKLCVVSNRGRLARLTSVSDIDVNSITIPGSQVYTISFFQI